MSGIACPFVRRSFRHRTSLPTAGSAELSKLRLALPVNKPRQTPSGPGSLLEPVNAHLTAYQRIFLQGRSRIVPNAPTFNRNRRVLLLETTLQTLLRGLLIQQRAKSPERSVPIAVAGSFLVALRSTSVHALSLVRGESHPSILMTSAGGMSAMKIGSWSTKQSQARRCRVPW